jgi:multiple sugar transport system substrate-binding protein
MAAATTAGTLLAACQPKTVVVKETVEVEKAVEVTKVVKETVEVEVEKEVEVTKIVKETVEKVVEVTAAPPPMGPVTLRLQRFFGDCIDEYAGVTELGAGRGECGIFQVLTNKWNAENPDMQIETLVVNWPGYDTLNAGLAADDPPEISVMHGHFIPDYASRGTVMALDDAFETEGINTDDFLPAALTYATFDGRTVGLPFDMHGDLWHINLGNWRDAGLLVSDGKPKLPTDPTEFEAAADAVLGLGKTFVDLQTNGHNGTVWPWMGFVFQQGGAPFDPDDLSPTLNTEEGLTALKFMASWLEKGYTLSGTGYGEAQERFLNGENATWITGTWAVDFYDSQIEEGAALQEYYCSNLPQLYGSGVLTGSHCWVLPKRSNPDPAMLNAATKFFKFLYDNNLEWARTGHLPVRRSVVEGGEYQAMPHRAEYAGFGETAVAWPRTKLVNAVETMMNEEIQAVYIGDKVPEEALASAQQRVEDFAKYM